MPAIIHLTDNRMIEAPKTGAMWIERRNGKRLLKFGELGYIMQGKFKGEVSEWHESKLTA